MKADSIYPNAFTMQSLKEHQSIKFFAQII